MAVDGLFSLFWVNMAFILLLFTVCCVRVRALGRKGQQQQQQEQQQQQQPEEQQGDDERRTVDDDDDDHVELGERGQAGISVDVGNGNDGTSLLLRQGIPAATAAATLPYAVDAHGEAALPRTACGASQLNELLLQYTKRLDESDVVVAAVTRHTSGGGGGTARSPVPSPPESSSEAIDDDTDGAEHHHTRSLVRIPAPGAMRLTEEENRMVGANVVHDAETPLPPPPQSDTGVIVAGSSSSTPPTTTGGGHHDDQRFVSDVCAICLLSMTAGEDVTWASNPNCVHVFHHSCILGWLEASCTKERERRRLRARDRSRGRRRRTTGDGTIRPVASSIRSRSRDQDPPLGSSVEEDQDQVEGGRTHITDHGGAQRSSTSATLQDDPASGTGTPSFIEADEVTSLLFPCPCCRQAFMIGVKIDVGGPPRPVISPRAAIDDDGGAATAQVVAPRGQAAGAASASATATARSRPPLLWNPFPALVTLPEATGRRR